MTKQAAIISIPPLRFVAGFPVFEEDAESTFSAANYAAGDVADTHGSVLAGAGDPNNWDGDTARAGLNILFDIGATLQTRFEWVIRVKPNVQVLHFYAECLVGGADVCEVNLLIDGTVRASTTHHPADNGTPLDAPIAVGAIGGPGEHLASIQIRRVSGALNSNSLVWWHLANDTIAAADLPDPVE